MEVGERSEGVESRKIYIESIIVNTSITASKKCVCVCACVKDRKT